MIIGKKEQERLEREQCAQISLLCRQKLMGYAESFEELGKSFRQEIQITGEDRQNILEKCMLWQSRQIMGDHLQEVARIMDGWQERNWGIVRWKRKRGKAWYRRSRVKGSSPETSAMWRRTAAAPGQKQGSV